MIGCVIFLYKAFIFNALYCIFRPCRAKRITRKGSLSGFLLSDYLPADNFYRGLKCNRMIIMTKSQFRIQTDENMQAVAYNRKKLVNSIPKKLRREQKNARVTALTALRIHYWLGSQR
jgi:hypothetical protein